MEKIDEEDLRLMAQRAREIDALREALIPELLNKDVSVVFSALLTLMVDMINDDTIHTELRQSFINAWEIAHSQDLDAEYTEPPPDAAAVH